MLLYNMLNKKLRKQKVYEIIKEAVEIEGIHCEALPCRLIGMNSDMMSQYIEFVADRLIISLYDPMFESHKPIPIYGND